MITTPAAGTIVAVKQLNVAVQCYAIITRTIFSEILIIDTPLLAPEGELWGVFCEAYAWFMFFYCHHSAECNTNKYESVITAFDCNIMIW